MGIQSGTICQEPGRELRMNGGEGLVYRFTFNPDADFQGNCTASLEPAQRITQPIQVICPPIASYSFHSDEGQIIYSVQLSFGKGAYHEDFDELLIFITEHKTFACRLFFICGRPPLPDTPKQGIPAVAPIQQGQEETQPVPSLYTAQKPVIVSYTHDLLYKRCFIEKKGVVKKIYCNSSLVAWTDQQAHIAVRARTAKAILKMLAHRKAFTQKFEVVVKIFYLQEGANRVEEHRFALLVAEWVRRVMIWPR